MIIIKTIIYEDYIKEYQLTSDEFCLLPYNMRLAYLHKKFSKYIKDLSVGESKDVYGNIYPCYMEYFQACGCKVENFDFGVETATITKKENKSYEPTDEEIALVDQYNKAVAEARWDTFETTIKDRMNDALANLTKHEVDLDLNLKDYLLMLSPYFISEKLDEKIKKKIMRREIKELVGEEGEVSKYLELGYRNVLIEDGYEAIENSSSISVRKLK